MENITSINKNTKNIISTNHISQSTKNRSTQLELIIRNLFINPSINHNRQNTPLKTTNIWSQQHFKIKCQASLHITSHISKMIEMSWVSISDRTNLISINHRTSLTRIIQITSLVHRTTLVSINHRTNLVHITRKLEVIIHEREVLTTLGILNIERKSIIKIFRNF